MATINPHTTRGTGTVLTASIYNTDHQNHIDNADAINDEVVALGAGDFVEKSGDTMTGTLENTAITPLTFTNTNVAVNIDRNSGSDSNTSLRFNVLGPTTADARIQLFLHTNTTGLRSFDIFRGDGSGTADHQIRGAGGYLCGNPTGGDKGVGSINAETIFKANVPVDAFPSGTRMIFQQTAAPVGWTKETASAYNEAALRTFTGTVTNTGGTRNFSNTFEAARFTSSVALTESQIPSHTHSSGSLATASAGAHTHAINGVNNILLDTTTGSGSKNQDDTGLSAASPTIASAGAHTHSITGSTASTGSGATHQHTSNLEVKFVGIITAQKD